MSILTEIEADIRKLAAELLGHSSHPPHIIEQHGAALTQLADKVAAAANPAPALDPDGNPPSDGIPTPPPLDAVEDGAEPNPNPLTEPDDSTDDEPAAP